MLVGISFEGTLSASQLFGHIRTNKLENTVNPKIEFDMVKNVSDSILLYLSPFSFLPKICASPNAYCTVVP